MFNTVLNYIEVLKPKEASLICFIGICTAIAASGGNSFLGILFLTLAAIALGSGGCNGLTNYLDREVDARMKRTRNRSLPSKRINPPQKVLPLTSGLVAIALALAWLLHPFCFFAGLIGAIASCVWRKTVWCPFLGAIASSAPIAIGWLAFDPDLSFPLLCLCILIWVWVPLHVWSVMIANRDDYLGGGVKYFPLTWEIKDVVKVLLGLSCLLYATSIVLYFTADFSSLYLTIAGILGTIMVATTTRLVVSPSSANAFRVYKLTAFPYLGIIFLAMCVDTMIS